MSLTTSAPVSSLSRLDPATLGDIVAGLGRAEEFWRPHVRHESHGLARVRLLETPSYEVWVTGWLPGQRVGLHHHGGANGAFVVVDGELAESTVGDRRRRSLLDSPVRVGDVRPVVAGEIHGVANRSRHPASSLHAYSRPLQSIGFYERLRDHECGHRVRTHWVAAEAPVYGAGFEGAAGG